MRQSTKTQRHKETLRGERRSGYLSVPRLSTSNPIRSLTRLRVKLQTGSEWLREDEQDDPEWSRSCSWCYGPAVCLCVFVLKVNLDPSTPLSLALVCVVVIVATRWHTDIKIPACKQDSSQEFKVAVRLFPARLHFDPCRKMTRLDAVLKYHLRSCSPPGPLIRRSAVGPSSPHIEFVTSTNCRPC
ncbi:hypothetical protein ABVT39_022032 [Epinephelus coioides]